MAGRDAGAKAAAQNSGTQAGAAFGMDMPAIQNQLNPNAATRSALTQVPIDAANSAFGAAQANDTNRVARTRNSAGYGATEDRLAMDKAKADSAAALQGQNAIQNLQNEGVKNAGQLFGVADSTIAPLYNAAAANTNASWDWAKNILDPALQAAGAAGSAGIMKCWIAAAVFDEDFFTGPRVNLVRTWLGDWEQRSVIGRATVALYRRFGERIAERVRRSSLLKAMLTPIFNLVLRKARS
jgi:hypothetical protein